MKKIILLPVLVLIGLRLVAGNYDYRERVYPVLVGRDLRKGIYFLTKKNPNKL